MSEWEYLITKLTRTTPELDLNHLGAGGWELVAFDFEAREAILKRQKQKVFGFDASRCSCAGCLPTEEAG